MPVLQETRSHARDGSMQCRSANTTDAKFRAAALKFFSEGQGVFDALAGEPIQVARLPVPQMRCDRGSAAQVESTLGYRTCELT